MDQQTRTIGTMRIAAVTTIAALAMLCGCTEFRPLADAGACRDVDCSGHGICVVIGLEQAVCLCEAGYINTGGLWCMPAGADADADADGDPDLDADADVDDERLPCFEDHPVAIARIVEPPVDAIEVNDMVRLDGSASHSPLTHELEYRWYFLQAPEGSSARLDPESNPEAQSTMETGSEHPSPGFRVGMPGQYEICLNVCGIEGICTFEPTDPECPEHNDDCLEFTAAE